MSRNYKFHNPDGVYFVNFAVVEWIEVFKATRGDSCGSGGLREVVIDPVSKAETSLYKITEVNIK